MTGLSPLLVGATDLDLWADRRDAQGLLPMLLRRLVIATGEGVEHISFRAEEGVGAPGWDGIVKARTGTEFVPEGVSAWEGGTGNNPAAKAQKDYAKRSQAPLGLPQKETTFVFATPRRWTEKREWADKKKLERIWRDVRVIDADDLNTWLESAPGVHLWLSALLGKRLPGTTDLESFWTDWSNVTTPALPPEFVLATRENEREALRRQVSQPGVVVELRAETSQEALAFFGAMVQRLPEAERDEILGRTVIVADPAQWSYFAIQSDRPLILVPTFSQRSLVGAAAAAGHTVVIPMGRSEPASRGTIEIPRPGRDDVLRQLKSLGLPDGRSRELASVARNSVVALRRLLAVSPASLIPEWAAPDAARSLLPAFLAGRWNDESPGDRAVLAELAGRPYEEYRKVLEAWEAKPDPPVRLIGPLWTICSKEDAWRLLGGRLTTPDLRAFAAVAVKVIGEVDPKYDLSPDEQWLAGLRNKVRAHSEELRGSLADTLALMAAGTVAFPSNEPKVGKDLPRQIVEAIFREVTSWQGWASLTEELALLAEAAPDAFMDAVERGVRGDAPMLANLFVDGDPLLARSPHVGVLWALEVVAWSPEFLSRAAMLLAGLARLDPGGKAANRPSNSLRDIFLPWLPGTSAPPDRRLKVLDSLRSREPAAAWALLASLLPDSFGMTVSSIEPRYRDWGSGRTKRVSPAEAAAMTSGIVQRAIDDAGTNGSRWQPLIAAIGQFGQEEFEGIVKRLSTTEPAINIREDRSLIRTALRKVLADHRTYPDAGWALPPDDLARLDEILKQFEPSDVVERNAHLFGQDHGVVADVDPTDWERQQETLAERQRLAAAEIVQVRGIDGLFALMALAQEPYAVGLALGGSNIAALDDFNLLEQTLGSNEAAIRRVGLGFVAAKFGRLGLVWSDAFQANARWKSWRPEQKADYLLALRFGPATWDKVQVEGTDVYRLYWTNVGSIGLGALSDDDRDRAARSLIDVGSLGTALHLLWLYSARPRSSSIPNHELAVEVLERITRGEDQEKQNQWQGQGYNIGELLRRASASGQVSRIRLATLEWLFLPIFRTHGAPGILAQQLADEPALFVEILKLVYRAASEALTEVSDEAKAKATQGHLLLWDWKTMPGLDQEGRVDEARLSQWVTEVRKLGREADRAAIADFYVGRSLANCPQGSDQAWPHERVRDLIEELATEAIDRGLINGVRNRRRVMSRPIRQGGTQERALADRYRGYAETMQDRWPRTARLLKALAESYEAQAGTEDTRAEIEEQIWK